MPIIKVRNYEFPEVICKDSHNRRAVQYRNNILNTLKRLGLSEDYVDVPLENVAIKKVPASVTWYMEGNKLHYSYPGGRYVDNLYVVSKVIEASADELLDGKITFNDYVSAFSESDDIEKTRKEAREALGVDEESKDMELITKNFKILAKEFHPDMPNGDHDKFKKINHAHKVLKRELEH